MADAAITTASVDGTQRGMRSIVWVTQDIGYLFNIGAGTDLDYVKTTNGGKTWGAAVDVFTGTVDEFDVWYDQWTPGNTGRDIHIAFVENGTDDVSYFRFNTVNDTKTSIVDIFAGGSAVLGRGTFVSITRARGGNLYVNYNIDAFAETGFYRSTDNGATWASRTNPLEANLDQTKLYPANLADPNDIWMLYDDDSAAELTVKTHDDSANTNSESSVLSFNNEGTNLVGQYGFDGAIRHLDGHLILAYCDTYDAAGGSTTDLKVYDWDGTNLTALTDIATNVDHIYYPQVYLNQDKPDWIYVGHIGVTAGTSTLASSVPVVYSLSKDRGVSWTKDIAYSSATTDYRNLWCAPSGERFALAWMDISAVDIIGNYDVANTEFGFTPFNNYQNMRAVGQNNTGIISVGGIG